MGTALPSISETLADRYRIDRALGQGGMGVVYLTQDVRHRRKVALKVLHPELSAVLGDALQPVPEIADALQYAHESPAG
jgi:serine/threonine-protein kinase